MSRKRFIAGSGLLASAAVLFWFFWEPVPKPSLNNVSTTSELPEIKSDKDPVLSFGPEAPALTQSTVKVQPRSSFYETLKGEGVSPRDILQLSKFAKAEYNPSRIRPGTTIDLFWRGDLLQRLEIQESLKKDIILSRVSKDNWALKVQTYPEERQEVVYLGTIKGSLWESSIEAGMDPQLVYRFAAIFEWQLDFSRELRTGDTWALLVEKRFIRERFAGYGKILAAELNNNGEQLVGIHFKGKHGRFDYFDLSGRNLRGKFLKSPLKFARISSRFQRKRFHPVLKINRPHLGVDYAARQGTPVRAVGDGIVEIAARRGGAGKMVMIRHNRKYKTAYKHLSRYGKRIRKGVRVNQSDIIGYVGQTGLASGPHLHFEFYENGRYVDPLGIRFPRASSVSKRDKDAFDLKAKERFAKLRELKAQKEIALR